MRIKPLLLTPLIIVVGLTVIVALFFRHDVWAALLLHDIVTPAGEETWLRSLTSAPSYERKRISTDRGELFIDVFAPDGMNDDSPALIVQPPWTYRHNVDDALEKIADSLARMGFVVVFAPTPESLIQSPGHDYLLDIDAYLRNDFDTPLTRIGYFGFCLGNGPIFAAATDERLTVPPDFIIMYTAIYDMGTLIQFLRTGVYDNGLVVRELEPSDRGKQFLQDMQVMFNTTLDTFRTSPGFMSVDGYFALKHYAPKVRSNVFVIHAENDAWIPYGEAENFVAHLPKDIDVHTLYSPLYVHDGVSEDAGTQSFDTFWSAWRFVSSVLREAEV